MALVTGVAAVAMMLPAPLPGHVVSSNDLVRRVTPFAKEPPIDPARPRNFQLTDPAQVFRPDLHWAREEVRAGRLPTWSPLVFGGWPLLASQQAAPLFPISAASYVLPYEASIAWRIIALLVLAAVGTFLFARAIGLGRWASAMAGVAYALSGPVLLWSMHPHIDVHAMLGWMLLGAHGSARGHRWGLPVLAAAVGCALLGGHPQSVFIDGMLVAAWGVAAVATAPPGTRLGGAARLAGGAVLGALAAAAVLLPFFEMLGQSSVSERGGEPGADLEALFTLALPDVWGRPDWPWSTDPPGLINYLERTAFVGALPALLACVGLAVHCDRRRYFFLGAFFGALVLAYDVPGVSAWLVDQWPLRLAVMSRALVLLAFAVAMLAGLGLQAILDRPGALRRPAVAAAAAAVLVVPLASALIRFGIGGGLDDALGSLPWVDRPTDIDEAVVAACTRWTLAVGLGIALLAVLLRQQRRARVVAGALVAVSAVGLAVGWHGYLPVMPTDEAELRPTPSMLALDAQQGDGRAVAGSTRVGPQLLVPNTSQYFGLRDPRGRGVPTLERTTDAWSALGGAAAPNHVFVNPSDPRSARLLRVFGVRTALVTPGASPPPGSRPVYRGSDGDVYAIDGALPRAFVTCRWRSLSAETATVALATAAVTALRERPLVEDVPVSGGRCRSTAVAARIVSDRSTEVEIEVDAASDSRLVLLDTWYPGWTAEVDGHEASIAPTNVAFRSVAVPAGEHSVVFRYRPSSVRVGAALSGLAWVIIVALSLVMARRRGRDPSGQVAPPKRA